MCYPENISDCNHWCADPKCGHRMAIHHDTTDLCTAPGCRCVGFCNEPPKVHLHETQKSVHGWCKAMFPGYVGVKGRAVALVEEAVELAIAAGVPYDTIRAAVEVPIKKETIRLGIGERNWHEREDAEEVADVLVCLYAYAEEAGYDAHQELDEKMELNRSRSAEYYAKKTADKQEKGFILPDMPPSREIRK